MSSPAAALRPPPAEHRIELEPLSAWLRAHVEDFRGPITLQQFCGGQSNPTYLIESADRRYVLRRKPPGKLLPSAHAVEREFRVISALRGRVPVARPHALCEDPAVIGSAFYVTDYVEGRLFWDAALPDAALSERRAIYGEMTRVMAALHDVEPAAAGLGDFGRPGGYVERQVARWTQQYRAAETEAIEAMDRLIEWLPAHRPAADETRIVHGDFRLDNVIFHADEPRILAVLDWELATLGHPIVDFAYFCMRHHLAADTFHGLAGVDVRPLDIPTEDECVRDYCRLRRLEPIEPREWAYYLVFNMFRLAGILQGVLARALQGNASSARALEAGRRARPLAEQAWALARRAFGAGST